MKHTGADSAQLAIVKLAGNVLALTILWPEPEAIQT